MNCDDLKYSFQRYIIIDIRSKEDFCNGHIPNSINIEHIELIKNASQYLNEHKHYLIICDEGITSKVVCIKLGKYKLTNVIGGFAKWDGPISKC